MTRVHVFTDRDFSLTQKHCFAFSSRVRRYSPDKIALERVNFRIDNRERINSKGTHVTLAFFLIFQVTFEMKDSANSGVTRLEMYLYNLSFIRIIFLFPSNIFSPLSIP